MTNSNYSCSNCGSVMQPISPDGKTFACDSCGMAVNDKNEVINVDKEQLKDILSKAADVIHESFGDKIPHSAKVILTARTIEYGISMWNDGLRQGMLLGLKRELSK